MAQKRKRENDGSGLSPKVKRRKTCNVEGCTNVGRAGGRCRKHRWGCCIVPRCTKFVHGNGRCVAHDMLGVQCNVTECTEKAHKNGKCRKHCIRYPCAVVDCIKRSVLRGLCVSHYRKWEETASAESKFGGDSTAVSGPVAGPVAAVALDDSFMCAVALDDSAIDLDIGDTQTSRVVGPPP